MHTYLCRVLGGRSTEGCNGGSVVKNTGQWCVGTAGRTLSSFHPSYNGSHWTPQPENKTHVNSINTCTDTSSPRTRERYSAANGRGYDLILLRYPAYNPWEAERIKRCIHFKVWRRWTILEINVNLISTTANWVGQRETERRAVRENSSSAITGI